MKMHMKPELELLCTINEKIDHCEAEGLPLDSIELDANEWDLFVLSRCKMADGVINHGWADHMNNIGSEMFRGIKVYKEKNRG